MCQPCIFLITTVSSCFGYFSFSAFSLLNFCLCFLDISTPVQTNTKLLWHSNLWLSISWWQEENRHVVFVISYFPDQEVFHMVRSRVFLAAWRAWLWCGTVLVTEPGPARHMGRHSALLSVRVTPAVPSRDDTWVVCPAAMKDWGKFGVAFEVVWLSINNTLSVCGFLAVAPDLQHSKINNFSRSVCIVRSTFRILEMIASHISCRVSFIVLILCQKVRLFIVRQLCRVESPHQCTGGNLPGNYGAGGAAHNFSHRIGTIGTLPTRDAKPEPVPAFWPNPEPPRSHSELKSELEPPNERRIRLQNRRRLFKIHKSEINTMNRRIVLVVY